MGLRRRRKAAAAAAAQMKVLLDKFKVWAEGSGGVGMEEVLKQQVEAAVEGYKHQLQVTCQHPAMKALIYDIGCRRCTMTCGLLKNKLSSSKQVTTCVTVAIACLKRAFCPEIADLKNGRIIQQLEQELYVFRSRCDELQV